jgi:hypothetical protein
MAGPRGRCSAPLPLKAAAREGLAEKFIRPTGRLPAAFDDLHSKPNNFSSESQVIECPI